MIDSVSITILKELRDFILPLSKEEFRTLEQNILSEGCRDPLVVWKKSDDKLVLVDGHNRFEICQKHNLPFKVKKIGFLNVDEAKGWMIDNQVGRRNLNPDQLSYYRGIKYISLKKNKGGYNKVLSKGQKELLTTKILSEQFKVSESTIKRDAKFAQGLEIIGKSNTQLKLSILSGISKVKKSDIQILSESKDYEKLKFKNEADLYNKAKQIHDDILTEVEAKIKDIENRKVQEARAIIADKEPPFLKQNDRLKKIKGMIISAINTAIEERNISAIKELKKLIEKLEYELLFEV